VRPRYAATAVENPQEPLTVFLGPVDKALPPDFARQLAELIAPGEQAAVATVLFEASRLEDEKLARFLRSLAARVKQSPALLTEAEILSLLETY
jgi:hypothetical protein